MQGYSRNPTVLQILLPRSHSHESDDFQASHVEADATTLSGCHLAPLQDHQDPCGNRGSTSAAAAGSWAWGSLSSLSSLCKTKQVLVNNKNYVSKGVQWKFLTVHAFHFPCSYATWIDDMVGSDPINWTAICTVNLRKTLYYCQGENSNAVFFILPSTGEN